MTQTGYIASKRARMARLLSSLDSKNPERLRGWEPSRDEMIAMRRLSRNSHTTVREAFEAINPPCSLDTFNRRAKAIGIFYETRSRDSNPAWMGK